MSTWLSSHQVRLLLQSCSRQGELSSQQLPLQDQSVRFEENVSAMSTQFSDLEKRMTSVASVATKFGDRLQVIPKPFQHTLESTINSFRIPRSRFEL